MEKGPSLKKLWGKVYEKVDKDNKDAYEQFNRKVAREKRRLER
jgi:hypothetical protein